MDKDPTTPSDYAEDEYHFSEQESPSDFSEAVAAAKTQSTSTRNKKILIIVGILAVAFSVYKLLDILFTARGGLHTTLTTTTTPAVAPTVTPVPTTTTAVAPTAPIASAPTEIAPPEKEQVATAPQTPTAPANQLTPSAVTEISNQLQNVEQKTTANQEQFDKLNGQITTMQTDVSNLNSRFAELNSTLQAINTKLNEQQAQEAARVTKHRLAVRRRCVRPIPVYFVKAMVAGRAWLMAENGRTLTVGQGDSLPGYGVVRIIDPHQGTVTLSSGAIIGYSPEDS